MAKKKKSPRKRRGAKPPPRCKAILLCEKTILEQGTGKVSIIGILDRFWSRQFPCRLIPFTVFVQLIDGIGNYDIKVQVHDLQAGTILGEGSGMGLTWGEKLLKFNVIIPIPSLLITHEGTYDLIVMANDQTIDRQKFDVKQVEARKHDTQEDDNPDGEDAPES